MSKTSTRRKRLDPAVFLEAARCIGQREVIGACVACVRAEREARGLDAITLPLDESTYAQWFTSVLKPARARGTWWYSGTDIIGTAQDPRDITARILGLTLCAILVEEGFQP